MKNISTGFGLCVAAVATLAYPFVSSLAPNANASAVSAAAVVSAAATAQTAPTIVWYGAVARPFAGGGGSIYHYSDYALFRAWSDGRVEAKKVCPGYYCDDAPSSTSGWVVVSDSAQGMTYRSDINFDSKVDGADLGTLLADWGDAPRQDIPPSDCPLNLVNP